MIEALRLEKALVQANQTIPNMAPPEQLAALDVAFRTEGVQLKQLLSKVQEFYSSYQVQNVSDLTMLSKKVSTLNAHLDTLTKTQEKLLSCWTLFEEGQKALSIDPVKHRETLQKLQPRVKQILDQGGLTRGCRIAFSNIHNKLSLALKEMRMPIIPLLDNPLQSKEMQMFTLDLARCRVNFKKLELEWNALKKFPTKEHILNFEALFLLYNKVKELKSILPKGLDPQEIEAIDTFLSHREMLLFRIVDVVRQQSTIRILYNALDAGDVKTAQKAFCCLEDKFSFHVSLCKTLRRELSKDLIDVGEISKWPGTMDRKKDALKELLVELPTEDPSEIIQLAEQLEQRLEKVGGSYKKGPLQAPVETEIHQMDSELQNLCVGLSDLLLAMDIFEQKIPSAYRKLLASQALQKLAHQNKCCVGKETTLIGKRPFFHLYHIHTNESPQLLKNDVDYGFKAFEGHYGFSATDLQRLRAMHRSLVELALLGLERAVQIDDLETVQSLLDLLEEIPLHTLDLPQGIEKLEHSLFGAMYQLHVEARKNNVSLVDPNGHQFKGDFGRVAFSGPIMGVEKATRVEAIVRVRTVLESVWKI